MGGVKGRGERSAGNSRKPIVFLLSLLRIVFHGSERVFFMRIEPHHFATLSASTLRSGLG